MKTKRLMLGLALVLILSKVSAQLPGQKQAVKPCKDCAWVPDQIYLRYKNTKNNKMIFEIKAPSSYFVNKAYGHLWIRQDERGLKKELLLDTRTGDFLVDIRNNAPLQFDVLAASKKGAGENPGDHVVYIQVRNETDKSSVIYTLDGKKVWEGKISDPLGMLAGVNSNTQAEDISKDWCFYNFEKNRLFNAKLEDVTKAYYRENPLKVIPIKAEEASKFEYKSMLTKGKEEVIKDFKVTYFYSIKTPSEVIYYSLDKVPFARVPLDENFMYNLKGSDGKSIEVMLQPFTGKVGPSTFKFSNVKMIKFDAKGNLVSKPAAPVKTANYTLVDESYLTDAEGYRVFCNLYITKAKLLPEFGVLLYTDFAGNNMCHDLNTDRSLFKSESLFDNILSENGKYALSKEGIWGFAEKKIVNTQLASFKGVDSNYNYTWWGNNIVLNHYGSHTFMDEKTLFNKYFIYFYKPNGTWEEHKEDFVDKQIIGKDKIKLKTEKGSWITLSSTGQKLN